MELDYKQAWLKTIHDGGKLRAYTVFQRVFFIEKYFLQQTLVNRKKLARLRISSHKWKQIGSIKPPLKTDHVSYLISG